MKSTTCYTHVSQSGHFRILSQRDDTCTILCGRDHPLAGTSFHGIKFADLRTCGCGRWRWPSNQTAHKGTAH